MSWLKTTLTSSLGRKYIMAITGLLLCGFLVVHLAGNVLLYVGPQAYNDYAHALHSKEWLVKIAELGLVLLFGLHIYLAFTLTTNNRSARNVSYAMKKSKIYDRDSVVKPDTWMFVSGSIVLMFLILHLVDFTILMKPGFDYAKYEGNEFGKAVAILTTPLSFTVYLIGSIILGFHLGHGVASSFQSLGLNHPKYNGLIKWGSVVFAGVVAIGFASFPIWAMFMQGGAGR